MVDLVKSAPAVKPRIAMPAAPRRSFGEEEVVLPWKGSVAG